MEVTDLGIMTDSNPAQLLKVPYLTSVMELGIDIDVNATQPAKALALMVLIVLGTS